MNKSDLSREWSKYINTDELVDAVCSMYKENCHPYSEHGVCTMLDEFFIQKERLIQMIVKSKNYIGNLRIACQKEFDRQINGDEVYRFISHNIHTLNPEQMLEYVDESGKTYFDYLYTGKNVYDIDNMPSIEDQTKRKKSLDAFNYMNKATSASCNKLADFNDYMGQFQNINTSILQQDVYVWDNTDAPTIKKGTKTSRAFNTICCYYGVDKFNPTEVPVNDENGNPIGMKTVYPYNKIFAAYSDLVSDLKRKMYFVISLNPLDYLTMSNGVSWKSCHNIYDGCYKGGTLSYMLDTTSIITFVVNELNNPIHEQPKFYRQMFHYDDGMFMQNRLYPQGNDGAVNLYDKFRNFVIEEFSELLNEKGEWTVDDGPKACKSHVSSHGVHYKDYHTNNSCNIFYPISSRNKQENHVMIVGHNGICAKCGKPFSSNGRLSHDKYAVECVEDLGD